MTQLTTVALILLLTPALAGSQTLLEKVKAGAEKATQVAGDAASKAVDAVEKSIDSTKKDLRDEATPEQTRAKLDSMTEQALARLFEQKSGSRELFERSAGYAVFDGREASFYVSAGYGRGVAVNRQNDARTYMKMATAGAGFSLGFGDFDRQLVILFEDPAKFAEFVDSDYDASAGVSTMAGQQRDELAVQFNDGEVMFLLTPKGWKVAAKLTGSRYWPDEPLNAPAE